MLKVHKLLSRFTDLYDTFGIDPFSFIQIGHDHAMVHSVHINYKKMHSKSY